MKQDLVTRKSKALSPKVLGKFEKAVKGLLLRSFVATLRLPKAGTVHESERQSQAHSVNDGILCNPTLTFCICGDLGTADC
jgi:hypothetical protein